MLDIYREQAALVEIIRRTSLNGEKTDEK